MEIKEIRTLVDLMKKNGLAVFQMEQGDFKITLKTPEGAARGASFIQSAPSFPMASIPPMVGEPSPSISAEASAVTVSQNYKEILSPMVGTFYTSPSPESPAFVEVGQQVNAESVVCIIEAMKVMNEIKAELSGKVVEVVAQNGKPVQFGEVLFRVS